MTRDEFMAIETARYIGLGMDLQAARSMAASDWSWSGGRTYDMRVAEARQRLNANRWQRRWRPTYEQELEQDAAEGGVYG